MALDILVVDDESDIRELIADILEDEGMESRSAKNSEEAFDALVERIPDAVVLDIWLKDSELDGLGILETVRRKYPQLPVIMISGHGNIEMAVNSLRMGAYDYIEKPFKQDRLLHTIRRSIEAAKLRQENAELKQKSQATNLLIGSSPAITQLRQAIEKVAPTGSRVFITGPAGAGKETLARIIHRKSRCKDGPFVVINASSLADSHADDILFGTEDSSDITAPPRKIGIFERAHGGTLFIDEVTDIPLAIQGRFVRFLQDKTFQRVGGTRWLESEVRVIAATRADVQQAIREGKLREDLFYRLNVVPMSAPNLCERREDIPQLAEFFLRQAAENAKLPMRSMSDDALVALQAYDWPGNIRQLRNVMEWLLIMAPGETESEITSTMLPREIFSATPADITPQVNTDIMSMPLRKAREVFEREYLKAQINRFGGNISRTASFVGMERSALHRKLKSLHVTQHMDEDEGTTAPQAEAAMSA